MNSAVLERFLSVLKVESQAIHHCATRLEKKEGLTSVTRALELLHHSLERGGKIVITGVGKSGKIGEKISATLSSMGNLSIFLHPTEGLHGDLGIVREGDLLLAISQSGTTEEILRLLPSLKQKGIPIIGMGGNMQSPLGKSCDAWLDSFVEQEASPHNLAPTSSTTLALALGDALAIALTELRGFDVNRFAENHPGGALGKRLQKTVKEFMKKGAKVPTVSESTPINEVVNLSTDTKFGAVLVVSGKKLLGLITDGDLRRALRFQEKLFKMVASDVMTAKPVTVDPETKAIDAIRLMENRESQIHVLPVVNSNGNWEGILRLHDLLQNL